MKSKKTNEEILQSLEAKVAKLEKLIDDNRWQKAVIERDTIKQDLNKCLAILDLALSGHKDWRERATDFLNSTQGNKTSI